ncbi:type II secretion system F family protein [Desulfallas sp. Bu1-1]|uniref:type II secretion system F family protein n=1 Tax=Desulfallas sp. Bu1-1 TaxID=2787620 RepID=UPI00189CF08A|nr:type II secretion system F family protein [Desulfallas sp. Bu1-1]MBF7084371.1 type II secretion system F family protein [Desulfallas sp. Bu1-1]
MLGITCTLIVLAALAWCAALKRERFLSGMRRLLARAESDSVSLFLPPGGKRDTAFKLQRLGIKMSYRAFIILSCAVGAFLGAVAIAALNNPILAVVAFVLTIAFAHGEVDVFYRKRRAVIDEQAEVALQMLAGLYQVTGDLVDTLKKVSQATASPLKEELQQVIAEYNAGKDLSAVLKDFAYRVDNRDIELFVQGVILSEHYGTDTSRVIKHIAEIIRSRLLLRDELKAETRGQSMTINLFLLLVPLAAAAIWIFSPTSREVLIHSTAGQVVLSVVAVVEFAAWYLTRKKGVVEEL